MLTCNKTDKMVVDAPNSNGPFQPVALMHFRGTYRRIILPVRPSDRKRAELCVHLLPFPFTDYRVVCQYSFSYLCLWFGE